MKATNGKPQIASVPNQAKQAASNLPPLPVPASPGAVSPVISYQMPEALHQELLAMYAQTNEIKVMLADKLLEMRNLEAAIMQGGDAIKTRIAGFAAAHGVDLNNLDHGRWNFDFPTGLLTKKVG